MLLASAEVAEELVQMAVSYCEMAINTLFYINLYRVMQNYSYNCVCVFQSPISSFFLSIEFAEHFNH